MIIGIYAGPRISACSREVRCDYEMSATSRSSDCRMCESSALRVSMLLISQAMISFFDNRSLTQKEPLNKFDKDFAEQSKHHCILINELLK